MLRLILAGVVGLVSGFAADRILQARRRRVTRWPRPAHKGIPSTVWAKISQGGAPVDLCGDSLLLSIEGKLVWSSEKFCRMVGYTWEELAGQPVDRVTATSAINVPERLRVALHFGSVQGLWMFERRDGLGILARYQWQLLPDLSIEMYYDVIPTGAE